MTKDFSERSPEGASSASPPSANAASAASLGETQAERHIRELGKGRWRVARKLHNCDAYFYRDCIGAGVIIEGAKYFDTEELREWTKGPIFWRVCRICASAKANGK